MQLHFAYFINFPFFDYLLFSGSSKASSTVTRTTVLTMSTSWIMYAIPSSKIYVKTFPQASWTKAGQPHLPPSLRYNQMGYNQRVIHNKYTNKSVKLLTRLLHCQFHDALQASEHLQRLHMRNMVRMYCKRVQPEWKKQVR